MLQGCEESTWEQEEKCGSSDSERRRIGGKKDDEARVVARQMHLQRVALRPNSLPFPLAVGDVSV